MFIFLSIVFSIVFYIAMAGVTRGYANHRWPPNVIRRQVLVDYRWEWQDYDTNSGNRDMATILWPFYWIFIWPFTKMNEITFSKIEKNAGAEVAKNKVRIAELRATRDQLAASNAELEKAEEELEKEIAKTL